MLSFLDNNNVISSCQFGFTKGKITIHAFYELLSSIQPAFTEKKVGICICHEFSTVFYTLDQNLLISRLHHMGIRGLDPSFIQSYLTNGCHYVRIGDSASPLTPNHQWGSYGSNLVRFYLIFMQFKHLNFSWL